MSARGGEPRGFPASRRFMPAEQLGRELETSMNRSVPERGCVRLRTSRSAV